MSQTLIKKAFKISAIFLIIFFLLNYFSVKNPNLIPLIGKSILAAVAFFLIYVVAFTVLDSPERKIKFGTTLPIAIIIGLMIGALISQIQIGVIIGIVIGILAGFIWEYIEKRNGGQR
ncbi:hypothetical protein [Staphylococcus warneri]|uniref:Uncharacterized protein n=2 Tax=Staphylococcus warneri TaxID=1292 RepID=A0A2T4Q3N4_STAWA|nr:hypothetical protein [Staphylococcus warneri]MBY6178370.1 hypothetical protein [Staphylococcaceae bacterium DP2N0-1]MDK4213811.1 hypothetical protein [Staphylococcus warneri]PTI14688.1 hypothetical protein BU083_03770 [Staphylococcus warneri]PTI17121.1 hypothetical protein BU084_08200 [Staphylococcus warneri]PTI24894.1 hypothetical protein BU080_05295 [Staphylococcus warneri]